MSTVQGVDIKSDVLTSHHYQTLFILSSGTMSNEWGVETPSDVTAQRGLCARIPCHYRYPSYLHEELRTGIWYNGQNSKSHPIVFHSSDHRKEKQKFRYRTHLSGDLKDDDCSLVIDNIRRKDEGWYFFRIEFVGGDRYSYLPATQLRVSDFTDKPTIFTAEFVEGKSVNITCIFNTTCDGTSPTLTWVTPIDVPPSVSSSVTRWHNTLTYTSVLTMTPALKHHGQSLTCRVRYPSVSSEQTLTLTVQYAPQNLSITSTNSVNNSWVNMKEGIPTSILCSVQSVPVSNLTWRHLGVTLNTTSSSNELWLVFPQVTPQQAGVYQCVAGNEHGTAERVLTLSVEYAPQNLSITSTNSVNNSWVNMKEGIPTSILCSVQSFPVSNLTWRHLGVTLNTRSSSNELWLEFPQVTPQQVGVYQCVAENEHGTAERVLTLSVEYKPEISRDPGCTRTPDVITCVCAARSNPPGELTWHLPLANLSGNQTHGRFQTWQVADGQLVTGTLTLGVGEGEGDVTALCTVRNQHGEVMFAVSLWMKGGVSAVWITVLLTSNVILSMLLAGFFISRYIQKRDARTKETALEILDSTVSSTAHLTAPQETERQRTSQIPREVSPVMPVGEVEECDPVYASLRELPSGGGPVRRGETVVYAALKFQSIGPA
ncbi:myelin-associated glycoprotein-like isoform X2 [Hypanus sabinus]|uniref:myelin-associated glycoprotein-like isoform X2 n=1 Tax=Hypanus sabinus TaxID=79690 RepID=UPI0028C3B18B|nr:myelin-associated glycoprotein-like isoform X2 [Hypanus sabinus]